MLPPIGWCGTAAIESTAQRPLARPVAMGVAAGVSPAAKALSDALNPKVQEWEQLMWRVQQPLPWAAAGQKWVPMERIFDLTMEL